MLWSETNIILAIIGMMGLFTSALVYQRSARVSSRYYKDMDTRVSVTSTDV